MFNMQIQYNETVGFAIFDKNQSERLKVIICCKLAKGRRFELLFFPLLQKYFRNFILSCLQNIIFIDVLLDS